MQSLLNEGEFLESTIENKNNITKEEVISRLYNAIFKKKYNDNDYHTELGRYEFTAKSKQFAIEVSNMMSSYADLS